MHVIVICRNAMIVCGGILWQAYSKMTSVIDVLLG